MPLVEIEFVGQAGVTDSDLVRNLADALGQLFDSSPGRTWVRLRYLSAEHYAENGTDRPLGTNAIFVKVTHRVLPATDILATEAAVITDTVAELCQRNREQVHVIYEPPGSGRIAFGGKLIT